MGERVRPAQIAGDPASAPLATGSSALPFGPLAPVDHVRFVRAPEDGDVTKIVHDAAQRAASEHRAFIVYVGAKWCEPCQRFHHAANRGELDAAFAGIDLTLLEFDLDADRDRLTMAGYMMKFIPYFGVPAADGRATERHIEGSVKGEGAAGEIAPRLIALLKP